MNVGKTDIFVAIVVQASSRIVTRTQINVSKRFLYPSDGCKRIKDFSKRSIFDAAAAALELRKIEKACKYTNEYSMLRSQKRIENFSEEESEGLRFPLGDFSFLPLSSVFAVCIILTSR